MPSALNSPVKLLAFVAVMALTLQGLLVCQELLRRPHRHHVRRPTVATPASVRSLRAPSVFDAASRTDTTEPSPITRVPFEVNTTPAGTGAEFLSESPAESPEDAAARVRAFYHSHGIEDADLVQMTALEESDRGYYDALARAQEARREGRARDAVEMIQEALAGLNSQHLLARARLLEALSEVALEAGDLTLAARTRSQVRETRDSIVTILSRAAGEKGGVDPEAKQKTLEATKRSEEMETKLMELASKLGADGDLSKLPEKLSALSQQVPAGR